MGSNIKSNFHTLSFAAPRGFATTFKSDLKETFFPDDPFNLRMFQFDLLAGITITSLADIPPVIGLYSCVVPSIVYAIFGNSKHVAVGTLGTSSLLIAETINKVASPEAQPALYLHLIFTVTFVTGIFQAALGFQRMGMLVDFLSHSTITGFMGGTATIICLQQFKGFFGLTHFTTKTDVISVMHALIEHRDEEMIAFGLMNLAGSFTSCCLTIGSKTAMSNMVMAIFVALTLLFLAPFFSYTPLIALCAVIISATLGLIKYEEAIKLFKVDKFDFCICMTAFLVLPS
ncbi:PREDICTED: sulfate [Prunus dulcis]|uniref:PREDICTED: sulfate n=1 Tax=Prunus dulcis TaxID=3755 RepID=A0A5E4E9R3_PRUDU|nr:PREDICTED: sulfate [Prunus dulcis]